MLVSIIRDCNCDCDYVTQLSPDNSSMSISFFIEPDREGSRPFYQFVQHREITVAHTSTGELMYWIALDVDCKPDQHSFTQVSLLDDGKVYNRIGYTVWHFKRDHSNHTSVAVKEVEQPNEVWDPVLVSDHCRLDNQRRN